jgi:predicted helicase
MNLKSIIVLPAAALLVFIVSFQHSFSQNLKYIDSLKKALPKQAPEKKFETLSAIGFEYRNSLQDSTFLYCNQALDLGKKIKIKSKIQYTDPVLKSSNL